MKNFLDKCREILGIVRDFFVEGPLSPVTEFIKKYWKYIVTGVASIALIVVLIIVVVNVNKNGDGDLDTQEGEVTSFHIPEKFEEDAYEEVNQLMQDYLKAYASGDQDMIAELARPLSDGERSYIGIYSRYIESYQNIKCYTKPAMDEGSMFVVVYYEIKFYGVDTTAPGLDTFYLEKDEEGNLYINNLYSNYNRIRMEYEMDSNVYYLMNQLEKQEDATELRNRVQEDYNAALASDVDLAVMISTTIPAAVNDWIAQMNAIEQSQNNNTEDTQVDNTEEDESQNPDDGENTGENPDADENQEPEQPVQQTVVEVEVTAGSVNVRTQPTVDSNSYGKALEGQKFKKLGESGDWTEVDYDGHSAYIKTEFLKVVTNN